MRVSDSAEPSGVHGLMQQRQVIKDPERTTLGRGYQFFFAFVNREISNRNDRQVQLHGLPVRAAIKREVHPGFSSRVEQTTLVRILPDHAGEGAVASRELGEFEVKTWINAIVQATRAVKADQESLRLQNEFYEKSKHPLDTPQQGSVRP